MNVNPTITKKNMKVLLVDDNEMLGFYLRNYLIDKGLDCVWVNTAEVAFKEISTSDYDFFILDILLPEQTGYEVALHIRKCKGDQPILFLSTMADEEEKLKAFEVGADDYLIKPFSMDELLMRINAIFHRFEKHVQKKNKQYSLGLLNFDFDRQVLYAPDDTNVELVETSLSHKEASILRMFCECKDKIVRKEEILEAVWGVNNVYSSRSMDVYLNRVRNILKKDPMLKLQNIHGVGYKLVMNEENA